MSWIDSLPASERASLSDAGRVGNTRFEGPIEPLLVNVDEAARLLGGIDKDRVYAMCNSGQLPHVRLGRRTLVSVEGMRQFIRNNDGREYLP